MDLQPINIEPSWSEVASIALVLLTTPLDDTECDTARAKGREIVHDMGEKLAALRAQQSDCPEHLKRRTANLTASVCSNSFLKGETK